MLLTLERVYRIIQLLYGIKVVAILVEVLGLSVQLLGHVEFEHDSFPIQIIGQSSHDSMVLNLVALCHVLALLVLPWLHVAKVLFTAGDVAYLDLSAEAGATPLIW